MFCFLDQVLLICPANRAEMPINARYITSVIVPTTRMAKLVKWKHLH